jgi:3-isopropylmalate/(R)-2-methylmalate dehydratase small subunit
VWGLQQFGFEAVIAPSFAEIFYSNAMTNRLLLVQLERAAVDILLRDAAARPSANLHIDIEAQTVTSAEGHVFDFPLGARYKRMVMEGMDTIDLTLASLTDIEAFERTHFERHRWAAVL